ncbi:MAG: acyl--CoA ligase [Ruminococcus sp.]|nr:acyl--CoA ligase [Ruminococcus sp.]
MENKNLTGYPSIDKPWLKYYSKESINAEIPKCSIYEAIRVNNEDNLDNVAFDFYGKRITYRELFKNIKLTAASLSALNIKKGDTVSVCMLNTPETIYLLYALNMIGAQANMLCPVSPLGELLHDVNLCNTKYMFTLDMFQDKILSIIKKTSIKKVIVADLKSSMSVVQRVGASIFRKVKNVPLVNDNRFISWKAFQSKKKKYRVSNNADNVAVILYTGGTTGGSKGVQLTNYSIVATAWQYINGSSDLDKKDTWAEVLPLFIAYGVSCALQIPLMIGMRILLRLPMSDSLEQLVKMKPNHIASVPNAWNELAKTGRELDLSFLVEPVTGGDTLPPSVEKKVNTYLKQQHCRYPLMNGYGMSEVCAAVSCNSKSVHKFGTVGTPFVKNVVAAFDIDTGMELKYDEEGELCILSPSMMRGYVNNPDETENVIRRHDDGKLWIHTGDLGFIDSDGFIHLCGRLKRYYVKYWQNGVKKVFCPDAERRLMNCPYIENCVIVPRIIGTEQLTYVFIIPADKAMSQKELIDKVHIFCENELGEVYRPDRILIIDSFPLTKVSKIDYRKLAEMILEEN